ncbi:MAG: hypothetical protein ACOYI8_11265, partial [Christensenellales bacterium]
LGACSDFLLVCSAATIRSLHAPFVYLIPVNPTTFRDEPFDVVHLYQLADDVPFLFTQSVVLSWSSHC